MGVGMFGRLLRQPAWMCALLIINGCAEDTDEAAPELVSAEFLSAAGSAELHLAASAEWSAELAELAALGYVMPVPTAGAVSLVFSELLEGDVLEDVKKDAQKNVIAIEGRPGIVTVAAADGTGFGSTISYHPDQKAIVVAIDGLLPADTMIAATVVAEIVQDKAGNVMDAATAALLTESVAILGAEFPAFGTPDDPETEEDESVPYDAPISLAFNTAIAAATVEGLVSMVPADGGVAVGATVVSEDGAVVMVAPAAPLSPETDYILRVEPGMTDTFGVPYAGDVQAYVFLTL